MSDALNTYLAHVNGAYKKGNATENTYRGFLTNLIQELVPAVDATNEPQRMVECGAPDYVITKKNTEIPIGYIEAKDINRLHVLTAVEKAQEQRYIAHIGDNLIYTDYLEFIFYKNKKQVATVRIADGKTLTPTPENFGTFTNLIKEFCAYQGSTITSAKKLAVMMADKAKIMADVIDKALTSDESHDANTTLQSQFEAFKKILIHDIKPPEFADVYAQTIAYGMFAARLHDMTLGGFTRQEAAELIPKTNPFLRKLFSYIAGPDIDDRIKWVVDALADVFSYANVFEIMRGYGKETQTTDPVIHFYETFLAEYDPALRKSRGVFYTPEPVVQFIVRAVDDILKTEFNLPLGLADTSKVKIKMEDQTFDKRTKTGTGQKEVEIHKVQVLDPATGTGTFLAEVIRKIHGNFAGQQGVWSKYVEDHLIPRVHGFELLMASYAMAHLKLDLLLKETGYEPKNPQRLGVYLTNSLEEAHPDTGTLFATWLSQEANEANFIKREVPVMVVLGNPPYSVSSSNKGEWIQNLIKDYKKDLNEKTINTLSDDYVKFIRYAQYYIDKNGQGVVAMITNNSFIDGLVHRQMRKSLLEDFDKIYVLDLHGSAKKKEVTPDDGKDENVFDIMQGVSISLLVKTSGSKKLAAVYHLDLYGKREEKYQVLAEGDLSRLKWKKIKPVEPYYFFVPKNFESAEEYEKGFKIEELFNIFASGVETGKDSIVVKFDEKELNAVISDFTHLPLEDISKLYTTSRELVKQVTNDLNRKKHKVVSFLYRPFDIRKLIYSDISYGILRRPSHDVMKYMLKENYGIITKRGQDFDTPLAYISNMSIDRRTFSNPGVQGADYLFPLYLYPDDDDLMRGEK